MQCNKCGEFVTRKQLIGAVLIGYAVSTIIGPCIAIYLMLTVVPKQAQVIQQVNVGTSEARLAREIGTAYRIAQEKSDGMRSRETSP